MLGAILNKGSSQTLLQDLDGSTRALRETSEKFVTMVTTPPMQTMTMCFWESKKTQVLKAVLPAWTLTLRSSVKMILVEEDSACLFGRPKKMLDAPHSIMNKFGGPSDANFGLVSNVIKNMAEKAQRIAASQREAFHLHNEHFMVSRRPNPLFTGREEELGKLKQALCPSLSSTTPTAVPRIYVIYGMGGAGKSEVALGFAHENRSEYWGVFWIDGRSESSITNGFVTIARRCGQHDESLEGSIAWLQTTSHSWLLIIDNADNRDLDLAQFSPAGRNGSVLITTRLTECAKYQTVGKPDCYERLNQETAIELLLKACSVDMSLRSTHEDNASAIVELLGCHALAVIQAGAAISQHLCDLGEYKDIFLDQRQALLECFPGQAKSEYGGVYATFEVSVTYLKARDNQIFKDALQLLNFYAFMHSTDFPEVIFEEAWKNSRDEDVVSSSLLPDGEEDIEKLAPWHVSHFPTFMRQNSHSVKMNKFSLRQARSLLASLSLVAFDSARGATHMHPVSHFWARDRLKRPEESMNAGLNGLSVLSLSIRNPYAQDMGPLLGQLQAHIEFMEHNLKEWDSHRRDFHFQQSVYRFSWAMYFLSCDSVLFELLRMIPIQTDESWIRTVNGQRIQSLHGESMCHFGDASKAVTLLEKVSEVKEQTLSAEDPSYLSSQNRLASAYMHIEATAKAIRLLEAVVGIRTRTLSPEHSDLLASQHGLAIAYLKTEKTAKAVELLERIVQTENETLRPEHPYLLASQHVLASAYLEIGETAKAIALLESVVKIEAKTLRPEHRDRLTSQQELARAYLEIGKTAKAIALLEPVVEIRARTLSPEHSDRVGSIYLLALCHRQAGDYERALQLAKSIESFAKNRPGQELAD